MNFLALGDGPFTNSLLLVWRKEWIKPDRGKDIKRDSANNALCIMDSAVLSRYSDETARVLYLGY